MRNQSTAYTYLCLSGQNINERDIFNKIKIKPTSITIGNTGVIFWKYRIDALDALEGIENALIALVEVFKNKTIEIRDLMVTQNIYVKVFVVTHVKAKESGGLYLSNSFIKFLESINAELEFDFYI
ncbi:MAG: DUF4279 domain-containing protein [Saprospiraceae bacterium]